MKTKKPIYFFKKKSKSCRNTERFLNAHNIPFIEFNEEKAPSKKDLLHILYLSSEGFETILKQGKAIKQFETDISLYYQKPFDTITTMETISFLSENPSFLKTPLVWSDCILCTTCSEDSLNGFLPNQNRYKKAKEIVYC